MYGKLINGALRIAPRRLTIGGCVVFNPTPAQYEAEGYLPVRQTEQPEAPEGFEAVSSWEEQAGEIVQVWHFEELPPEEPSAEEILSIILGGEDE